MKSESGFHKRLQGMKKLLVKGQDTPLKYEVTEPRFDSGYETDGFR